MSNETLLCYLCLTMLPLKIHFIYPNDLNIRIVEIFITLVTVIKTFSYV